MRSNPGVDSELEVSESRVQTWEEAEDKFPAFAYVEALDQFIEGNPKKMINSNRYITFHTIPDSPCDVYFFNF